MYVIHREAAISSEEQVYIQFSDMEVTAAYSPKGMSLGGMIVGPFWCLSARSTRKDLESM